MKGIDCSTPLNSKSAQALSNSGIKFVCRYLVPSKYAGKRITRTEASEISSKGLQIISVFETTASRTKGGAEAGRTDGLLALNEAKLIGQAIGSTIYFAVDYDAPETDYDEIEAYLRNAFAELNGYAIGVYGSFAVVQEMYKRKACTHFWQTYAWSHGKLSEHANIYQHKNGVSMAGITVDLNESNGNEGFWNLSISATLKHGMVSEDVKILQDILNKCGYKLLVDGKFSIITQGAVKDFQRSHGLKVDGIVGPLTWEELKGL